MGRTELPWLVFDRLVRPYALAVSLASGSLGVLIASDQSLYGVGRWSDTLAVIALLSTLLLWVGWWMGGHRGDTLMRHGLLLTAGVFASRAVFMALTGSPAAAAFMGSWALGSAGAYLLEATTGHDLHRSAWTTRNGAEGGGSE